MQQRIQNGSPWVRRAMLIAAGASIAKSTLFGDIPRVALELEVLRELRTAPPVGEIKKTEVKKYTAADVRVSFDHEKDPIGRLPKETEKRYLERLCWAINFYFENLPPFEKQFKRDEISFFIKFGGTNTCDESEIRQFRPWIIGVTNILSGKPVLPGAWGALRHDIDSRYYGEFRTTMFKIFDYALRDSPLSNEGMLLAPRSTDGWPVQNKMMMLSLFSKVYGYKRATDKLDELIKQRKIVPGPETRALLPYAATMHSYEALARIEKNAPALTPYEREWLSIAVQERKAEALLLGKLLGMEKP